MKFIALTVLTAGLLGVTAIAQDTQSVSQAQNAASAWNKGGAVETVTPLRDKDGTWRVSGYFIK